MTRKHTRRKIWGKTNPITHAIEGACLTPESLLNKLRTRELAAIESFRTGDATLQDWADITEMLNLCENMALGGIGPEALETCRAAEAQLIALGKLYEKTKDMPITEEGLQAFRDLYSYHDLQRQSVSRGEYEKWINKTTLRIKSKAPEVMDMAEVV